MCRFQVLEYELGAITPVHEELAFLLEWKKMQNSLEVKCFSNSVFLHLRPTTNIVWKEIFVQVSQSFQRFGN